MNDTTKVDLAKILFRIYDLACGGDGRDFDTLLLEDEAIKAIELLGVKRTFVKEINNFVYNIARTENNMPALEEIETNHLEQIRKDAARWRYVKEHLIQVIGPHLNGTYHFRFLSPFGRAKTVDEVIDHAIEVGRCHSCGENLPLQKG